MSDGQNGGDADRDQKQTDDRDQDNDQDGSSANKADADTDDTSGDDRSNDSTSDNDGKKKTPIYKKPLFWIIFAIIAAVLVVGGILFYLHARQYESTDDAFVDAHLVRIAPQVPGTLVAVADVDNRHVEAGRLLAVIQPNGPQAQLAQAQAGVQQAEAQYRQAQAQVDAAIAARQQAQAQAASPLADAVKAQRDLARYGQLERIDPNAVAAQQVDQARANAQSTSAQAAAARRQVDQADAQVAVARRQVKVAQAGIGAARAQVDQAKVTLGNLRLTAPVAGQVVNRSVNLGSYVGPGTQLMAIVPENIWITANFKETQLTYMRVGQAVDISVDAFPGVKFIGHVDSVTRGAGQAFALLPPQNATGNYVKVVQRVPVRITFDVKNGPDPRNYPIGPGMSVVPTVKVR